MSKDAAPSDVPPRASAHVRVLLVEDSPVLRELLVHLLNSDPALQVVGTAADGMQAVLAAERLRPDVVVMDIHLPELDGFDATRKIMETCPTRIVMVTATFDHREVASSFRAVEAGALAVLAKPVGPAHPGFAAAADELVQTVKVMSEVRVVKRWPRSRAALPTPPARPAADGVRLVAIGASTGGPIALQSLLSHLPRDFPVPILIVQHISEGFTAGFAEWLCATTGHAVRVAVNGEQALPGLAYVAPNGLHMKVSATGAIELAYAPEEHGLRPAVSVLFRSAAAFGAGAAGVLLTGMGRDGAQELKRMRDAGAVTFAQDAESSVVHGMPAEAIRLDAAAYVLPPDKIGRALGQLISRRDTSGRPPSRQGLEDEGKDDQP